MHLIPVWSVPTLRIHYESKVCSLPPGQEGELVFKFTIPAEYTANHLMMLLKLTEGRRCVGPNLLLFCKIITKKSPQADQGEVSAFASENLSAEGNPGSDPSQDLSMIAKGMDIYNE